MEQTTIEFLENKLTDYLKRIYKQEIEEAKQIEKQQKIDFARHCLEKAKDLDILTSFMNVEQYYNKTFKLE